MKIDPSDMRSIMDTIELSEAPLSAKIGRGINKIKSSLGSNVAKGKVDNDKLTKRMDDAWGTWLGQTGKTGNIDDLKLFLTTKVGFNSRQVDDILSSVDAPDNIIPKQKDDNIVPKQDDINIDGNEEPIDNLDNSSTVSPEQEKNEQPKPQDKTVGSSDPINSSINILDTYMTRKHLTNIKPETANKILKSIKDIIMELPKVHGEDRIRGANSAMDAIAALEFAGVVPKNYASEVQGYLNVALKNDNIKPFSPQIYDADAPIEQKPNTDKVENVPDSEQPTEKPRFRVKANSATRTESVQTINEDGEKLSSSDVYNIFKAASNYAYSNGIVGNNNNSQNSSGYSQQSQPSRTSSQPSNSNSSEDKPSVDKKYVKHLESIAEAAAKLGIDAERYSQISEVAHKNSFAQIKDDDRSTLAAIGYAFMRSM